MTQGVHHNLKLCAEAHFTEDMAQNLLRAFDGSQPGAIITLEVREFGLWVKREGIGSRWFIGSATPPSEEL